MIGKALIKVSIQSFFTIIMFSHHIVENIIVLISSIVPSAEAIMRSELEKQKSKLFNNEGGTSEPSIVATIWGWVITLMIGYFVYAFTNAIIQNRLKNDAKEQEKKKK